MAERSSTMWSPPNPVSRPPLTQQPYHTVASATMPHHSQTVTAPRVDPRNYYPTSAVFYPGAQAQFQPHPSTSVPGYYEGQHLMVPPHMPMPSVPISAGQWNFPGPQTGIPCPKIVSQVMPPVHTGFNRPPQAGVMPPAPYPTSGINMTRRPDTNKMFVTSPTQPMPRFKGSERSGTPPRGLLGYTYNTPSPTPPAMASLFEKIFHQSHPIRMRASQSLVVAGPTAAGAPPNGLPEVIEAGRSCVSVGSVGQLSSPTTKVGPPKDSLTPKADQQGLYGQARASVPRASQSATVDETVSEQLGSPSNGDSQRLLFEQKASSHGIRIEAPESVGEYVEDDLSEETDSDLNVQSWLSQQSAVIPSSETPHSGTTVFQGEGATAWSTTDGASPNYQLDPEELYESDREEQHWESSEGTSSEVSESEQVSPDENTVRELTGHVEYLQNLVDIDKAIGDLQNIQDNGRHDSIENYARKLVLCSLEGAKASLVEEQMSDMDTLAARMIGQGAESRDHLESSHTSCEDGTEVSSLNPMCQEFVPNVGSKTDLNTVNSTTGSHNHGFSISTTDCPFQSSSSKTLMDPTKPVFKPKGASPVSQSAKSSVPCRSECASLVTEPKTVTAAKSDLIMNASSLMNSQFSLDPTKPEFKPKSASVFSSASYRDKLNAMAVDFKPPFILSSLRQTTPTVVGRASANLAGSNSVGSAQRNLQPRGIMTLMSGAVWPKVSTPVSKILSEAISQTMMTSVSSRDEATNTKRIRTKDSSLQVKFEGCDVAVNTLTEEPEYIKEVVLPKTCTQSTNTVPPKPHHKRCQAGLACIHLTHSDAATNTDETGEDKDLIETIDSLQYDEMVARAYAAEETVLQLRLGIALMELGVLITQVTDSFQKLSLPVQKEWDGEYQRVSQAIQEEVCQLQSQFAANLSVLRDGVPLESLPPLHCTIPSIPPVLAPNNGDKPEMVGSSQQPECDPVQVPRQEVDNLLSKSESADSGLDTDLVTEQKMYSVPNHQVNVQGTVLPPQDVFKRPGPVSKGPVNQAETDLREESATPPEHKGNNRERQSSMCSGVSHTSETRPPPGLENLQDPIKVQRRKSVASTQSSGDSRTNSSVTHPDDTKAPSTPAGSSDGTLPPPQVWLGPQQQQQQDEQLLQLYALHQQQQQSQLEQLAPLVQPMMLSLLQVNPALALQPDVLQMTALQYLASMQQAGFAPPPAQPHSVCGAGDSASMIPHDQSMLNSQSPTDTIPKIVSGDSGQSSNTSPAPSHVSGNQSSMVTETEASHPQRSRYGPRQLATKGFSGQDKVISSKEQVNSLGTGQAIPKRPVESNKPTLNVEMTQNNQKNSPSELDVVSESTMRNSGKTGEEICPQIHQVSEYKPPGISDKGFRGSRSVSKDPVAPRFARHLSGGTNPKKEFGSSIQHQHSGENWDEEIDNDSKIFFQWNAQTKLKVATVKSSGVQPESTGTRPSRPIGEKHQVAASGGERTRPTSHKTPGSEIPKDTIDSDKSSVWATKAAWSKKNPVKQVAPEGYEFVPAKPLPVVASSLSSVPVQSQLLAKKPEGFKCQTGTVVAAAKVKPADSDHPSSFCPTVSEHLEARKSKVDGVSGITEITFDDDLNDVKEKDDSEDQWQQTGKRRKKHLKFVASATTAAPSEPSKLSSYERLVKKMMESFTHMSRAEVVSLVQEVRVRRGGLQGATMTEIIDTGKIIIATRQKKNLDGKGNILHKTTVCTYWKAGTCTKGSDCEYAHGRSELKKLPKHIMCPNWKKGKCINADKCVFAHGVHELVKVPLGVTKVSASTQAAAAAAMSVPESGTVPWSSKVRRPSSGFSQECDNDEDGEMCVICCYSIRPNLSKRLDCGHMFHHQCITRWLVGEERTCPTCRTHSLLVEEFPHLGS